MAGYLLKMSIFHVGNEFFWPTKGSGGLQHHKILIFDGQQHPKNTVDSGNSKLGFVTNFVY